MIQRFAVEFDRRVVGIAVRVPGGFMFFASDDAFEQLDGHLFPRARAISRHLQKISARKPARGNAAVHLHAAPPPGSTYTDPVRPDWPGARP